MRYRSTLISSLSALAGNVPVSALGQDRDQVRAKRGGVDCADEGDENGLGAIHPSRCARVSTFPYTFVCQSVLLCLKLPRPLGYRVT